MSGEPRRFGLTRGQFTVLVHTFFTAPILIGLVFFAGWARESNTGLVAFIVFGIVVAALVFGYKFVTGREIDDPPPPRR